jgi:hypothetical protein
MKAIQRKATTVPARVAAPFFDNSRLRRDRTRVRSPSVTEEAAKEASRMLVRASLREDRLTRKLECDGSRGPRAPRRTEGDECCLAVVVVPFVITPWRPTTEGPKLPHDSP